MSEPYDPNADTFLIEVERRRLIKEKRVEKRVEKEWPEDLIPERQYERTQEAQDIDDLIRRITIVEAYERWIHKSKVTIRPGQTESIMIRCPNPDHIDNKPDAWLNTSKNLWSCGPCNFDGGDVLDLAAIHFGFKRPEYKVGRNFHELRRAVARDYGYTVQTFTDTAIPDNIYKAEATEAPSEPVATVTPIRPIQEVVSEDEAEKDKLDDWLDDIASIVFPTLDWKVIVTENTFLDAYMQACIVDDAAEEYHFWNGLLAIGLAVGRDVTLFDLTAVYANLMLCVLGRTGDRKTRAMSHLLKLIRTALPFDYSTGLSTGVKVVQGAASGEHLIYEFIQEVTDPLRPKVKMQGEATRGLALYSELSDLIGRSARQGSVIKGTLMEFADASPEVTTGSRTSGTLRAVLPFMSAATTTQPESLKDLVSQGDAASGFLNRWIFASGKAKTKIAIGGARVDVTPAVLPLQIIHTQFRREIQWSQQANGLFTEHFHRSIEPNKRENPILGRLDLLEKKLVLLLSINENLNEVTEEIVQKVISMHTYLLAAYGLTAENMVYESDNNKIYNDILRQIQRLTPKDKWGPTAKNIRDRLIHKKYDRIAMQKMFDLLAKDGERIEINTGDPSKPGRKTEHFRWIAS